VLLNALSRHVPSTEAAIDQINAGLRQHLEVSRISRYSDLTGRRYAPPAESDIRRG
jgi:hypothetical protein